MGDRYNISPGPSLPCPKLQEKNKFYKIGSFYTSVDAEFHDDQLLIKALDKKNLWLYEVKKLI